MLLKQRRNAQIIYKNILGCNRLTFRLLAKMQIDTINVSAFYIRLVKIMPENKPGASRVVVLFILLQIVVVAVLSIYFFGTENYSRLRASLLREDEMRRSDRIPPEIELVLPVPNSTLYQPFFVEAEASDNQGVWRVEFVFGSENGAVVYIDENPPYRLAIRLPSSYQGQQPFYAEAVDKAGNRSKTNIISVAVDGDDVLKPRISITQPPYDALVNGSEVIITAFVSDNNNATAKVNFYQNNVFINDDLEFPFEITWDSASFADGIHALKAEAFDPAANNAFSPEVQVIIDNTGPTVSFLKPDEGSTVSGHNVQLSLSVSDANSVNKVELFIDDQKADQKDSLRDTTSFSIDSWPFKNGEHIFFAKAYDSLANVSISSLKLIVDNDHTPPTVSLTDPPHGAFVIGKSVSLSAFSSDNLGVERVQFYLDNDVVLGVDFSSPYNILWDSTTIANGRHKISARVFDTSGNSSISKVHTVKVVNPKQ